MLPGQALSPDFVLQRVLHRKWLAIIPFVLCGVAAAAIAKRLPDQFRSETVIVVVPARVPDSYVKSTTTERLADRLPTIKLEILSRPRLEEIIKDLDLYKNERRTMAMEDVVRKMLAEINVDIDKDDSFRVSYRSLDAQTAQRVATRLGTLFIEENRRQRESFASDTSDFLDSQLQDAKAKLIEHEKKLEEYRQRYSGELPTQGPANLQSLQSAQMQLQALTEATQRVQERRLLVERQMADVESSDPVLTPTGTQPTAVDSAAQQLQAAQTELQQLLTKVKPDHPDVRILQRKIRDLETSVEADGRRQAPSDDTALKVSATEATRRRRARDLQAQLDEIDRELKDKQQEDAVIRGRIADYQAKVDAVPKHESEMVELTRDYATLQNSYSALLAKREDSKIAANLERRNIGEQFKVIEPALVPEHPFMPNRPAIAVGGAIGGMALGLLLIGFLEYRDSSLKNEADVVRVFSLPVLATVPLMGPQKRLFGRS